MTGERVAGSAVFDKMTDAVSCYDPHGLIVYVNPVASRIFDRPIERLVGENLWDLYPQFVGGAFHVTFEKVGRTGESDQCERLAPRGRWYEQQVVLVEGRIWVIARDVTEQKLAAARLALLADASRSFSEAWSDPQTMFENIARNFAEALPDLCSVRLLSSDGTAFESPVGLWDRDPEVRAMLLATPAVGAGEAIGPAILQSRRSVLISHIDPAAVAAGIAPSPRRQLVEKIGIHSIIIIALRARGQVLGILSACRRQTGTRAPYTDVDVRLAEELADRAALVVGQWQTLQLVEAERTRLANLLVEREVMVQDLREAIAVRDDFVSIASHELRTPLTALRLQQENVRRAFEREPQLSSSIKLRAKLDKVSRQVERLSTLVETLLDVSRLAAGRMRIDPEDIDLVRVTREVVERFEEESQRTKTIITVAAPDSLVGFWDRSRIDQVLTNLIANALKYGHATAVFVTVLGSEEHAIVTVRDEGIGIAPDALQRIFGRFERAVSSNHYGGLGLGLYIAHEIVVAHGGSIEVESELGGGTTFTVRLRRNAPPPP